MYERQQAAAPQQRFGPLLNETEIDGSQPDG
jgi:hypothetical protein